MVIRRLLTVCVLVVIAMLTFSGPLGVLAQDATPVAECVAPELPPGTPTPMEEDAATPEAEGSPVAEAEGEADPAELAEEETTNIEGPASPARVEAATAGLENALNCIAAGDYLGFAALMTPDFVSWVTETGNPYDVPLSLEGVTPMRIVATGEPVGDQDHRVGLHLVYGDFFNAPGVLTSERWYLVQEGEFWKIDEIVPVSAPDSFLTGYTLVDVAMVDFAFSFSMNEVPAGPVVLRFTNTSYTESPHVAGAAVLGGDISAETIIQMDALPDEELAKFLGAVFAEPGQSVDLIFENLEPGEYTVLCDFTTPDDVEHWMLGMVAHFTVV